MKKIIIYCEKTKDNNLTEATYQLISCANKLKQQAKNFNMPECEYVIEAVAIGFTLEEESIKKAYKAGASKVVLIKEKSLSDFNHIKYAKSFVEYFNQNSSVIILFPATPQGRAVAPRICTMLDTGLVADCTALEFIVKDNQLKLAATRPTFGSELMATILSKRIPQCATIRENVFKEEFNCEEQGEYIEYTPSRIKGNKIKLIRALVDEENTGFDFSNAKIILCSGWGLYDGTIEYYEKLEKLADLVGARFAATRKVVDFNIVQREVQIGQTGSTVNSKIYIGFGVSGAIQHISGMKNCETIIAINTDSEAPIFNYSDYKVVADAKDIIDELIALLENNLENNDSEINLQ